MGFFGPGVPVPGILEGGDLRFALGPRFVLEEDVIAAVGVEGRVEIDEIDALVGDVFAQDVEVVALKEGAAGDGSWRHRSWRHRGSSSATECSA
jgi:hypothetical protein